MNLKVTRTGFLVFSCATLLGLGIASFGAVSPVLAWGETGISPESGGWCGLTDDGGTIRFEATGDRRFVQDFNFHLMSGAVSIGEQSVATRAQVKSSKFILRGSTSAVDPGSSGTQPRRPPAPGGPGRCVRVPCRPIAGRPGAPRPTPPEDDILVRGTFEAVDSVAGTFKIGASVGFYTAWPARFGCP